MLDHKVKVLSESLARGMGRRKFLKQAGATVFGGMAALAAGQMTLGRASAAEKQPIYTPPQCAPPGPYCNLNGVNEPNGCRGGSCFQHRYNNEVAHCRVMYGWYQAGCWTTPVTGGYWVCCDCECFFSSGRRLCGCAQHSTQPYPRPDSPGDGADS
jgi:hypothetical protein